ncbi:hypothetical protein CHS0354_039253 [Potamilus streckersoni]|uniref:Uncharacterized protein n=1 Tax=Potamilus streckersoni TaxID=2493646 RepID=A0AAE0VNL1_9BIVA|nr:hypothetical protein CHS0354_039253 [Potamilus streckersoni]
MSRDYKNSPVYHDSSTEIIVSSDTCKHNNDAEMKNKIPKDNVNVDTTKYCIRKDILFVKENCTELAQNKPLYNEGISMLIEPEKHDDTVSQNDLALSSIEFSESVEKVGRKCVRDGVSLTKAIKRFKSSPQKMSRDASTDKYTTIMFLITTSLSNLKYTCNARRFKSGESHLQSTPLDNKNVEAASETFRDLVNNTATEILGPSPRNHKGWIHQNCENIRQLFDEKVYLNNPKVHFKDFHIIYLVHMFLYSVSL